MLERTTLKQLKSLEKRPEVRNTVRWLRKERKSHYGAVCVPLGDNLVLSHKGFGIRAGFSNDIFPAIVDEFTLLRPTSRRLATMNSLNDLFAQKKEKRLGIISSAPKGVIDLEYVGVMEPNWLGKVGLGAVVLGMPCVAPAVHAALSLHLWEKGYLSVCGPVKYLDESLAQQGARLGKTPSFDQILRARRDANRKIDRMRQVDKASKNR